MIYFLLITYLPLVNFMSNNFDTFSIRFREDVMTFGTLFLCLSALAVSVYCLVRFVLHRSINQFLIPYGLLVAYLFYSYETTKIETIWWAVCVSFTIWIMTRHIFWGKKLGIFLALVPVFYWGYVNVDDVFDYFSPFMVTISSLLILQMLMKQTYDFKQGHKFIPFVLIAMYSMPIKTMGWFYITRFQAPVATPHEKLMFNLKYKPNIYYILLDAYGRQDTLKDLNFNNEPFLKELEEMGFAVSRKAWSNYPFTAASLSATMSMNYHKVPSMDNMRPALRLDNAVQDVFRANDYCRIAYLPYYWRFSRGVKGIKCIHSNTNHIINRFLNPSIVRTPVFPNEYLSDEDLIDLLDQHHCKQDFTFIHLLHVHDVAIDAENRIHGRTPHIMFLSNNKQVKKYTNAILGMNIYIKNVIESIQEKDPNAIIVIQSDHGPIDQRHKPRYKPIGTNGMYPAHTPKDVRCRFGVLSAVYLPKLNNRHAEVMKYFKGTFSLVNTFRMIFSYLADEDPKLLPDERHFLYVNKNEFFLPELALPKDA